MDNSQVPETKPEVINVHRGEHRRERPGLFFPLLLVAVGVFFLLSNMNLITGDFWNLFTTYWPVLMIMGGLDNLYRRDGWIGPLFWAGSGALLLAANLGYLPWDAWFLISRFWPLMILAIGLDILVGRRGLGGAVVGTLLAVGLIAGVLWLANATATSTGGLVSRSIDQPLQGATQANIEITTVGERLNLGAQPDSSKIVTGDIEVRENEEYTLNYTVSAGKGSLTIKPQTGSRMLARSRTTGDEATWEINLNQQIPQDLHIESIFTSGRLDLSLLSTRSLELENVFSDITLSLPQDSDMNGSVNSVFGRIKLIVPRGVPVEIDTSGFIMSNVKPEGFQNRDGGKLLSPEAVNGATAIEIDINQVFGSLVIEYAE